MRLLTQMQNPLKNDPWQTQSTEGIPTLTQAREFFIQNARVHGRSRQTLKLYQWVFDNFSKYVGDPPLDRLNAILLRQYLLSLVDRWFKPTSVGMTYRVLHAFFVFAVREQLVAGNPMKDIPTPKVAKLFPFTLDESQVTALLRACSRQTKYEVRNYAMLLLFLDCGLRLNELVTAKLTDVSLVQRSLKVHGKGAKDRIIFMGAKAAKAVRQWVELRGFRAGYADTLFITRSGEPLKARFVQDIVAKIGKRSGLKVKLSPHKLRHVSAALAVKNGMDAFTLQRLYGWENVQTAMRYVNAAAPQLREAHAKASPVDRLLEGA
ncbi:tyrosine-type recombinase/integrase [Candidatus Acetothermia bacterium]|nr:tyrosine-type recombinase/integrase [Candidatus Acetothermia bacterium]